MTYRLLVVFTLVAACVSAGAVHLKFRATRTHNLDSHVSLARFIVAGSEKELDRNVRAVIPGAIAAHAVIGPTTAKTGQVIVGPRPNNGPAAKPIRTVYLDIETFNDNPAVGFVIDTKPKMPATDESWAKFASTSQTACDHGDTDLFLVFHRRTSDPKLPFLVASSGRHSPELAQEYLWPKIVQHIDKRTRRVIVVACYGWFSASGFQSAVDKYNAHSTAKWLPTLIGNKLPMSLTEDGEWSTLSTESVRILQENPNANVFQLSQNVSIKDAHMWQIGNTAGSGFEVSPFPNVKLASVSSFQQCLKAKIKPFPSVQAADRRFARAMLINPASITETEMTDAMKLCVQNEN